MRQKPARRSRQARFAVLESKLRPPPARPGTVPRTGLVNRLRVSGAPVVRLVAPAGYGKTTLLGQWAERDRRPVAWVSIDAQDDDPAILGSTIASALDRVEPPAGEPVLVILDDGCRLRERESVDMLVAFSENLPDGSTLVLSGRDEAAVPVPRLRAQGRILEVGTEDLALSPGEAELLLRGAGVQLDAEDSALLASRTEGWAAGLYLAALSLQAGSLRRDALMGFGGNDRFVADYLRFEVLGQLSDAEVRFLTRSAVFERLCGKACDAVVGAKRSALMLERLERASAFLVPLDRQRDWYRYHELFRELLLSELERREPEVVPDLYRRAAAWCEVNGLVEDAVEYTYAAGDREAAAGLVRTVAMPVFESGRVATAERWLATVDRELRIEDDAQLAVTGAWVHALRGRVAEAERWADAAESGVFEGTAWDGSSPGAWLALLRGAMCRNGIASLRSDAEAAIEGFDARSAWAPAGHLFLAVADLVDGDQGGADIGFLEAYDLAMAAGAPDTASVALAERALLALERGERDAADQLAKSAKALVSEHGLEGSVTTAIVHAANARVALLRGDGLRAREELACSAPLRPLLSAALSWFSVQTLLELGRVSVALVDETEARTILAQAREILRRRPSLGTLAREADELERRVDAIPETPPRSASSLTTAELRLVPFLSTHLTFREIAERLYISRNTVKTQAISVYRKLGVSCRGEAIARAAEVGLVDRSAVPPPRASA